MQSAQRGGGVGAEMIDECPFLREWMIRCCTSVEPSFVITKFIVKELCRGEDYRRCRFQAGPCGERMVGYETHA